MTKFDDCEEAVNVLNNIKGSIENKIRTAYNLGYKQGLEDGKIEAVRSVYTWVFKETEAEQTEPSGKRGEMMSQKEFDEMVHRVVSGQTEPSTDCSWK